jgi:hypothetical protein
MPKCTHCGKPIVLIPSATERAKSGGKPSDYIRLFRMHNTCQLKLRQQATSELIRRYYNDSNSNPYSPRRFATK